MSSSRGLGGSDIDGAFVRSNGDISFADLRRLA